MKEIFIYLCVMLLVAGGITGVVTIAAQDSSAVVVDDSNDIPVPQEDVTTGSAPSQATTTLVYYNRSGCANGVCSVSSDQFSTPTAQPVKSSLRERPLFKARPKPLRAVVQRLRRR